MRWTGAKLKRLWTDESIFQTVFGNHERCVLQAKEEKEHPDCYQQKVQNPPSVITLGYVSSHGKGNVHICDGKISAERYKQGLK